MFTHTRLLSPVILDGVTQAPVGSYEYDEWWDLQEKYCREGFTTGDISITGLHYYYLNFWPIRATVKGKTGKRKTAPRFLDMDYNFFWEFDRARKAKKDFLCLKRRQGGFSYKSSCIGGFEFEHVPDSHTLITSGEEKYSVATMRMIVEGLDHHANGDFYRNRMPNEADFKQASFKEYDEFGVAHIEGIMSKLERRTATDIQALIGLSPSMVIYEEVGKFRGVKGVKAYIDPGMEEMNVKTGIQLLIGTGGEQNESIDEVADMMYHPAMYGLMEYDNDFGEEPGLPDNPQLKNKVAYFVPADYFTDTTDQDGNSHRDQARRKILDRRKEVEGDKATWIKRVTQFPLTIEEALMQPLGNIFPVQMLQEQKSNLLKYAENRDLVRTISIEWVHDTQGNVVGVDWKDDPFGIYRMTEAPVVDEQTKKVLPIYVAGTDSYDKDQTADPKRESKGSIHMWKQFNAVSDPTDDLSVCKMVDRPPLAEEFFENTAKLCVMYGWAPNLIEWSNITIFHWYRRNGFGHLIKGRPEVAYAAVRKSNVQNKDGIDPNTKGAWETMTCDYLTKGGAFKIRDIETVDKLIRYTREVNCDESIAFMLAVVHKNDVVRVSREKVAVEPFRYRRFVVRNGRMVRL
jgi:hypothetical protein